MKLDLPDLRYLFGVDACTEQLQPCLHHPDKQEIRRRSQEPAFARYA
jgi:hypothetical protein